MSEFYEQVTIDLGERRYRIVIGDGLLMSANAFESLPTARTAVIVSNPQVASMYGVALRVALVSRFTQIHEVQLPDGEAHKNWQTLNLIFDALLQNKCDR